MNDLYVVAIGVDGSRSEPTLCHPRSIAAADPNVGLANAPVGTVRLINGITYQRVAPPVHNDLANELKGNQ